MTSGLQDFLNVPELDSAFFYNRTRTFTDEQILALAMTLPPLFEPGEPGKYHYSNTNYLLLGMIINKVTGNPWQGEITNRVINKLNLSQTVVPSVSDIQEPFCNGYMKGSDGKVINVTEFNPSITGAAGCMISTIEDLRTYSRALADGILLSDSMEAERLKTVPTGTKDFLNYGLGILSIGSFYGHNGGITGFNTSMYYSPKLDAMFVLNVNMFGPTGGVSDKIFADLSNAIYPGEMPWGKSN
jgi:D-alanyl-D-alanine carboxypeptidase